MLTWRPGPTELKKLELSLEGGGGAGWSNVTEDPSLADYLQYFKSVPYFTNKDDRKMSVIFKSGSES